MPSVDGFSCRDLAGFHTEGWQTDGLSPSFVSRVSANGYGRHRIAQSRKVLHLVQNPALEVLCLAQMRLGDWIKAA